MAAPVRVRRFFREALLLLRALDDSYARDILRALAGRPPARAVAVSSCRHQLQQRLCFQHGRRCSELRAFGASSPMPPLRTMRRAKRCAKAIIRQARHSSPPRHSPSCMLLPAGEVTEVPARHTFLPISRGGYRDDATPADAINARVKV